MASNGTLIIVRFAGMRCPRSDGEWHVLSSQPAGHASEIRRPILAAGTVTQGVRDCQSRVRDVVGEPLRMLGRENGLVRIVENGGRGEDGFGFESPVSKLGQLVIDGAPRPFTNGFRVLIGVWVVRVDERGDLGTNYGSRAVLA